MVLPSIEKEPNSLQEVFFQNSIIKRLELYLKSEQYPEAMFFSGAPGTGKTTTAKNFIKTVRCVNRPYGSTKACGECAICKSDPRTLSSSSNILWIQKGKENNMAQQLKELSSFIESPPELAKLQGEQEHTNRKFVVIDELQTVADSQVSELLFQSELGARLLKNRVTVLLLTMAEENLNPITRDALISRCQKYDFLSPTEDQLKQYLRHHYGDSYPAESLNLVAKAANNNLRSALNLIGQCLEVDPDLSPVVVADQLHYFDDSKRKELWSLINSKSYSRLKKINEFMKATLLNKVHERNLIYQMIEDIDYCLMNSEEHAEERFNALKHLIEYVSSPVPEPIHIFFKVFSKHFNNAVDLELLEEIIREESGFDKLQTG